MRPTFKPSLDSEIPIELELSNDQRGTGLCIRLNLNDTINRPRDSLFLSLILSGLDELFAANTAADLDNVLGNLERDAALLLAAKSLGEREPTRLSRRPLGLERVLLLLGRVVHEIGSEERLGDWCVRARCRSALELRLGLRELNARPVNHDLEVFELAFRTFARLSALCFLPHVCDPFLDHYV